MSADDMQALRAIYDRWAEGDFRAGEQLFAPDVVMKPFVEGSPVRGWEGMREYMRGFLEQWDDFRIEAQEFTETKGSILVTERQSATGTSSGIETVQTAFALWTFRDGRVVRVLWELDRDAALDAAGE